MMRHAMLLEMEDVLQSKRAERWTYRTSRRRDVSTLSELSASLA
jgi:hypothetical protein